VIGQLLFLIFVQDMPDWLKSSIRIFADDTKIWTRTACLDVADSLQPSGIDLRGKGWGTVPSKKLGGGQRHYYPPNIQKM